MLLRKMVVADLVKDIEAKKLKALEDRLKKEKPNQRVPSQKNSYTTPLIRAVDVGFLAGVEALLKAGAEVDGVDSSGCTALHIAAARSAAADAGAIAGELYI